MQLGPVNVSFTPLKVTYGAANKPPQDVTIPAVLGAFALLFVVLCCCGWVF